MYVIVNASTKKNKCGFDWDTYFKNYSFTGAPEPHEPKEILREVCTHLRENKYQLVFSLDNLLKRLLKNLKIKKNSQILELGSATGLLTRWLITRYSGKGILVDNNLNSYNIYKKINDETKKNITYCIEDIFKINFSKRFDIICSFGFIEHFPDKRKVLEIHKKFLAHDGYVIIIVPYDSLLSRVFWAINPHLNLGYRELIGEEELKRILKDNDLDVLGTQVSFKYSYDFIGAICMNPKSEKNIETG